MNKNKIILIVKCLLLPVVIFLSLHLCLFPLPSLFYAPVKLLQEAGIILSFGASLVISIVFTISLFVLLIKFSFKRKILKNKEIKKYLILIINFLLIIMIWHSFYTVRDFRMYILTKQFSPLISAINEYKKKERHYPNNLNLLIPKYIQKLPSTAMCGYPNYDYYKDKEGFFISLSTSIGILNWDKFEYSSTSKYYEIGDSTKIINKWRYIYE